MATSFSRILEHWMASVEESSGVQLNSKQCLVDLLQDVTQRNVPFPKMKSTLPLRFEASSDRQFVYFGRKQFVEIVKHIDRNRLRRAGVRLLGNVGSGKSHLLAAYALYLQCCRVRTFADTPRVVYIPNCTASAPKIYEDLLTALQESFPLAAFPNDVNRFVT
jgi:chromosomal replication initiation ATPase DnaA